MGGLARQPIQGGRWWWGGYIISSSGFSIFPFLFFLVRRARMMNEGGISLDSGHRDTTPKSDFRCSNQLAQHTHRKVLLVSLYYICIWPLGTIFGGGWDFFTQKKKKTGIGNERFCFLFFGERRRKSRSSSSSSSTDFFSSYWIHSTVAGHHPNRSTCGGSMIIITTFFLFSLCLG